MNVDLTHRILQTLGKPPSLIKPVPDRLGHDRRYCLDTAKLRSQGWSPQVPFDQGLRETVDWYRANEWWWRPIKSRTRTSTSYYQARYDTATLSVTTSCHWRGRICRQPRRANAGGDRRRRRLDACHATT